MKLAHVTTTMGSQQSQFISKSGIERERWKELERKKEIPLRVYSAFVGLFFFFQLVSGTTFLFLKTTQKTSIHKHVISFCFTAGDACE